MAQWVSGNQDEARKWYDKAIEWMDRNKPMDEELRRFRAEALAVRLENLPVEILSDDWQRFRTRGDLYARAGQWQQAADDCVAAMKARPEEHDLWYFSAPLWVRLNNKNAYRAHCAEMLQRFGETTDPTIAERTVKACLLLPDTIEELTPVMRLAKRAVSAQDHGYYPFFLLAAGLTDYRAGEFAGAVEKLDEIVSQRQRSGYDPTNLQVPANLVLAMAHHRLGHKDEATQAFHRARNIMQRDDFLRIRSGDLGGFWHDWLICQILRLEAEELLNLHGPLQTSWNDIPGEAQVVPTVDKGTPLP